MGRAHFAVGLILAATILVAAVVPIRGEVFVLGALFDIGHVLGFALIAAFLVWVVPQRAGALRLSGRVGYVVALVLALALAAGSEAVQLPLARDASLGDLLRDAAGIAAGSAAATAARSAQLRRAGLAFAAAVAIAIGLFRPIGVLAAYASARSQAATAFGFERWFDAWLVGRGTAEVAVVPAPVAWPTHRHVLSVKPGPQGGGLTFHGMPADWSRYAILAFTVGAESPDLDTLVLVVNARAPGQRRPIRFRTRLKIQTVPRDISIPITDIAAGGRRGPLNLTAVESVSLLSDPGRDVAFYIDDLRIE